MISDNVITKIWDATILACTEEIISEAPAFIVDVNERPQNFKEIIESGWSAFVSELAERGINIPAEITQETFLETLVNRIKTFADLFELS